MSSASDDSRPARLPQPLLVEAVVGQAARSRIESPRAGRFKRTCCNSLATPLRSAGPALLTCGGGLVDGDSPAEAGLRLGQVARGAAAPASHSDAAAVLPGVRRGDVPLAPGRGTSAPPRPARSTPCGARRFRRVHVATAHAPWTATLFPAMGRPAYRGSAGRSTVKDHWDRPRIDRTGRSGRPPLGLTLD